MCYYTFEIAAWASVAVVLAPVAPPRTRSFITNSTRRLWGPQRAKQLPHEVKVPSPLFQDWRPEDFEERFVPFAKQLKTFGIGGDVGLLNAFQAHDPFADIAHHIKHGKSGSSTSAEELRKETEALREKNISAIASTSQKLESVLEWEDEDDNDSGYGSDSSDDEGGMAWAYRVEAADSKVAHTA